MNGVSTFWSNRKNGESDFITAIKRCSIAGDLCISIRLSICDERVLHFICVRQIGANRVPASHARKNQTSRS